MMEAGSAIVRKDSVEELCGHRARALELYAQVAGLLLEARDAHARACIGNSHISSFPYEEFRSFASRDLSHYTARVRAMVDADMWRGLIVGTPLGSLMDRKERGIFEDSLKGDPPEAIPGNIHATMMRLIGEADTIFRRGLVEAFRNLCRDYRSHDGFKIGDRVVLTYVVSVSKYGRDASAYFSHRADETLQDVDRVMHVLDGKPGPEYQQGICAAMRAAMLERPARWETETDYFRVKWFLNGNAHLWFKRKDLVERANRLIAEHYGTAVGAAPDVAQRRGRVDPNVIYSEDFFFTPENIVDHLIDLADVRPEHTVLEPEAGEGHIAAKLAEIVGDKLECVELNNGRAQMLREQLGDRVKVRTTNFLEMEPAERFDRIIMNPPFSNGQAERHLLHATRFLSPGGRLVAVMPAGTVFRSDRITIEARQQIRQWGGTITPLPEDSFKDAGTSVRVVVVVVDKAAAGAARAAA